MGTQPSLAVGRCTIARTWELTPRLIGAFAAGIDDPNPAYLDDARPGGLIGHPGLAFTFQWNSRHLADTAPDPTRARLAVHAWVDVRYAHPFRQGDVITAQGQTIAVQQITPGALVVQRVAMRDSSGDPVAWMDNAGLFRGERVGGPDQAIAELAPQPEPLAVAARGPLWSAEIAIAPHAAHVYTECADIWNPIHTEQAVARGAGLPGIILHGSATLCIALRELVNRCLDGDPTRVARLAGRFRAMVVPGESITVRCLAERPGPDGRTIFFDVLNQSGRPAVQRGFLVDRG